MRWPTSRRTYTMVVSLGIGTSEMMSLHHRNGALLAGGIGEIAVLVHSASAHPRRDKVPRADFRQRHNRHRGSRSRRFRCKFSARYDADRAYGGRAIARTKAPGVFVSGKKSSSRSTRRSSTSPSARATLAFCGRTTHDTAEQKGREKGGLRNPFTVTLFADSLF